MKKSIAAVAVLAALGAWWFVSSSKTSPDAIVQAIRDGNPQSIGADITLDRCHLRILQTVEADEAIIGLTRTDTRFDIAQYDLRTVRAVPASTGYTYVAQRKPLLSALLDEAEAIAALIPADVVSGSYNRASLQRLLLPDDAALTFSMIALLEEGEDGTMVPQTHEDGPAFHTFIENINALENAPVMVRLVSGYRDGVISDETFLTGEIVVGGPLLLTFQSPSAVEAFGQTLYSYQQQACPRG